MSVKNEQLDAVTAELRRVGIQFTVAPGKKSLQVKWIHNHEPRMITVPSRQSGDPRATLNSRAEAARVLRADGVYSLNQDKINKKIRMFNPNKVEPLSDDWKNRIRMLEQYNVELQEAYSDLAELFVKAGIAPEGFMPKIARVLKTHEDPDDAPPTAETRPFGELITSPNHVNGKAEFEPKTVKPLIPGPRKRTRTKSEDNPILAYLEIGRFKPIYAIVDDTGLGYANCAAQLSYLKKAGLVENGPNRAGWRLVKKEESSQ